MPATSNPWSCEQFSWNSGGSRDWLEPEVAGRFAPRHWLWSRMPRSKLDYGNTLDVVLKTLWKL